MNKNQKRKILVITGTRAEYGLLKSIIKGINVSKKLSLLLLVTGTHTIPKYGLTIKEIKKDGFPISFIVKINEQDDMLSALSKEIIGIKKYCVRSRPDFIVVLGDRDEAFAGAIVGSHLGIPVAHIHGGDFTGAVVDGLIRHAITKLSHLHFTACRSSFKRVLRLQENQKSVFLVGAPGIDELKKEAFLIRKELAHVLSLNFFKPWLLFILHPASFDKVPLAIQIKNALYSVAQLKDYEKIIVYPNSDTGSDIFINNISKYRFNPSFHIFPNIPRNQYVSLLKEVCFLIGNSSSGIIESTFFKLPAINIGDRQKNRERGKNIIDCSYRQRDIFRAITKALSSDFRIKSQHARSPYGNGRVAKKIISILERVDGKKIMLNKTYS